MNEKYSGIDLFKVIMAVCVVAIHTRPLEKCSSVFIVNSYNIIVSSAVPYFFLATGFLLANEMSKFDRESYLLPITICLKKMVKLYVVWSIIYLPLSVYGLQRTDNSFTLNLKIYIKDFIFYGSHYNSWILWYLLSSVYTLCFVLKLSKHKINIYYVTLLGLIVFLIGVVIDFASSNIEESSSQLLKGISYLVSHTIKDGRIMTGFLYIPMGMLLYCLNRLTQFKWFFLVGGLAGSVLASIIGESNFLSEISKVLMQVFLSVGLFLVSITVSVKNEKRAIMLRTVSKVMYFSHLYVWTTYYCCVYGKTHYGIDAFLVVVVITALLGILWYSFITKMKNRTKTEL